MHAGTLADLEGANRGCNPPPPLFKFQKYESNITKQNIDDNPFEKKEERKSCMFV